jgi:hypothetical protein
MAAISNRLKQPVTDRALIGNGLYKPITDSFNICNRLYLTSVTRIYVMGFLNARYQKSTLVTGVVKANPGVVLAHL